MGMSVALVRGRDRIGQKIPQPSSPTPNTSPARGTLSTRVSHRVSSFSLRFVGGIAYGEIDSFYPPPFTHGSSRLYSASPITRQPTPKTIEKFDKCRPRFAF